MKSWKLKRTHQCKKCPWIVGVDPTTIPNGYCAKKHADLESTIAKSVEQSLSQSSVMACHEMHDAHCIGWIVNQIGVGNNIGLRIRMMTCENAKDLKLRGKQHERFEDTLP